MGVVWAWLLFFLQPSPTDRPAFEEHSRVTGNQVFLLDGLSGNNRPPNYYGMDGLDKPPIPKGKGGRNPSKLDFSCFIDFEFGSELLK